jgi:hypothetical protein
MVDNTDIFYKKYKKYKNKYFELKNKLGGYNSLDTLDTLKNYYIVSSHNSYLSGNQITGKADMKCITNFIELYKGGCIELDLFGIKENDIIVRHMPIVGSQILLSDIFKNIKDIISNNKMTGPIILYFDNKIIDINNQQIFWYLLFSILSDYLYPITNINILDTPLNNVIGKILIMWDEYHNDHDNKSLLIRKLIPPNKNDILNLYNLNNLNNLDKIYINEILDKNNIKTFFNNNKWTHFNKSNIKSKSINPYFTLYINNNKFFNKFIKNISYTQNNILRIHHKAHYINSTNFPLIPCLLNGAQMIALNTQSLDIQTLLMRKIFNNTSVRLKPLSLLSNKYFDYHNLLNDFKQFTFNILNINDILNNQNNQIKKILLTCDGENFSKSKNNIITIKNVHIDFLYFYIEIKLKNNKKYMGVFEINKNLDNLIIHQDITCILHTYSSKTSDKKLHCEWPKNLEENKDNIQIKIKFFIGYMP